MKLLSHIFTLALVLFLLSSIAISQSVNISTAYFKKGVVEGILSQAGCAGLRTYPSAKPEGTGNCIIIIGIDQNGNELYDANQKVSQYRMSAPSTSNPYNSVGLTSGNAETACVNYTAGNSAFVSDISASSINSLLTTSIFGKRKDGIVIQFISEGENNFSFGAYREKRGGAVQEGDLKIGDPCPSACGGEGQYLSYPQ